MRSSTFGLVHVGLAAAAALLTVLVTDLSMASKVAGVLAGLALGAWAGAADARSLERRVDRGRGIVLYAQDTAPYALLWPLGALALSPFAFGTMMRALVRSPDIQLMLQVMLCSLTTAWLAHDVLLVRALRHMAADRGPVQVQWFHGHSVVGPEGMIGRTGEVTSSCAPTGYVRIAGELWRAQSIDRVPLGRWSAGNRKAGKRSCSARRRR
jgi:membrane protein implicated in regulation of membrane protease activity